jgi:hypothetical protein
MQGWPSVVVELVLVVVVVVIMVRVQARHSRHPLHNVPLFFGLLVGTVCDNNRHYLLHAAGKWAGCCVSPAGPRY